MTEEQSRWINQENSVTEEHHTHTVTLDFEERGHVTGAITNHGTLTVYAYSIGI